jgi:hypothetical protein
MSRYYLIVFALASFVAGNFFGTSNGSLILNGGFESPDPGSLGYSFPPIGESGGPLHGPSTDFKWTVLSGNVEVVNASYFASPFSAFEGIRVLDLNGSTAGSIYQGFSTNLGVTFEVTFSYSSNSSGENRSAFVDVFSDLMDIDGSRISLTGGNNPLFHAFSHANGTTGQGPDWQSKTLSFVGTGSTLYLRFASTNGDSGGIILDGVSVTAIPEPSSAIMVVFCGLILARRRVRLIP